MFSTHDERLKKGLLKRLKIRISDEVKKYDDDNKEKIRNRWIIWQELRSSQNSGQIQGFENLEFWKRKFYISRWPKWKWN